MLPENYTFSFVSINKCTGYMLYVSISPYLIYIYIYIYSVWYIDVTNGSIEFHMIFLEPINVQLALEYWSMEQYAHYIGYTIHITYLRILWADCAHRSCACDYSISYFFEYCMSHKEYRNKPRYTAHIILSVNMELMGRK